MSNQLVKLTLTVDVTLNVSESAQADFIKFVREHKAGVPAMHQAIELSALKLHGDVPLDYLVQTVVGETLGLIVHEAITITDAPPSDKVEITKCIVQYEVTPDKLAVPADATPLVINVGAKADKH